LNISKRSNLLEFEPHRYKLQDVNEPILYRDIFPYYDVPNIPFNHRKVDMNMPENIWITDTTFRDGQQARTPYTVEQIVDLYEFLHRLGGPNGTIRQSEFFVYSKKDRDAMQSCRDKGYKYPEITTWIRASKADFELIKNIGVRESGILVSCSDYHIFKKLKMTRRQAFEHYLAVVKDALETGIAPRCHLEDLTRADFYGFVVPFVNALMDLSEEASIPIKFRICDTLGFGIPYSGVTMPRSVPGIISGLQHFSGVPSELIEWHGHNDFYKAVANATAAWLYGACAVNCSLLGIGERTGNIPLEAMVFEYASLKGSLDGMDPTVITEIAHYYENHLSYKIPSMTPFVGKYFNQTRAGIHADGLIKDEEIYNIFDTEKILNKKPSVIINNVSGVGGITYWLNNHTELTNGKIYNKTDPVVIEMKEWIDSLYNDGRQNTMSDQELTDFYNKKCLNE